MHPTTKTRATIPAARPVGTDDRPDDDGDGPPVAHSPVPRGRSAPSRRSSHIEGELTASSPSSDVSVERSSQLPSMYKYTLVIR